MSSQREEADIVEAVAHKFNPLSQRWEPSPREGEDERRRGDDESAARAGGARRETLRLATFNVWFGQYRSAERFRGLMALLRALDADFVCLQEATELFLSRLREVDWVRQRYFLSDASGETFRRTIHYGVVMMSKHRPEGGVWRVMKLPSNMGRKLLYAAFDPDHDGQRAVVATVHLESLDSSNERREQLASIASVLGREAAQTALLAGDFNLCATWPENAAVHDTGMQDTWALLRPRDKGWTEDTEVNGMLHALRGDLRQVRFDRVLWRGTPGSWAPSDIELLGTAALAPEDDEEDEAERERRHPGCECEQHDAAPPVWPSDHFGLCLTLKRC